MSYLIQYTRLTTSDRLTDRFLTSQVYNPTTPDQAKMGMIFCQVEILNPWFPTSQIGQTIINTIIREYYRGTDNSELVNFEKALRSVNETLSQIAQNGETDWVGNINALIALVNGKEIHLTQAGRGESYLFRDGKINHITEGLATDAEPHPAKTFSNITSGTLQVHDKILIGNPSLFDQITVDILRDFIQEMPPTLAGAELANLIRRQRLQNTNAIIFELTTKDELANLPLEHKIDTIYLDQIAGGVFWGNIRKFFKDYGSPAWQKTKEVSEIAWQKTKDSWRNKVWPSLKIGSQKIGAYSATGFKKAALYSQKTSVKLGKKIAEGTVSLDQKMAHPPTTAAPSKPTVGRIIWQKFARALTATGSFLKKLKIPVPLKNIFQNIGRSRALTGRQRYITIAAILLIILIGSIAIVKIKNRQPKMSNTQIAKTLEIMRQNFDSAQIATTINDTAKAVEFYQKVVEAGQSLRDESEAENLIVKSEAALDQLTQTKTVAGKVLSDKAENVNLIKVAGMDIYLISSREIKRLPPAGEIQKLTDLSAQDGNIKSADYLDEKKRLFVLSDQNKVLIYDPLSRRVFPPALESGEWETADRLKIFDGNIYLLSFINREIIKHSKTESEGAFLAGSPYIDPDKVDFDKVTDWTIDGRVLLLKTDGSIQQLSKNSEETIAPGSIPAGRKILRPARIFASFDTGTVFILDAQSERLGQPKLYEFNKSGEFQGAYLLSKEAKNFSDAQMDLTQRKIWILSQNKILEFGLE